MNKRLFPLVQAAMIAAALIGGNAASIVSAEDAPVIPQETALTDSAEPDTPEPETTADEPAETPEEPEAPAEPEIVEFAAEPEEAALEALMSAPESEPIEPEIVQAAAETLSAMPTARKAAALKAMRPVTYVPEGLPEGVTLSVDVPPAAFSEPVEIYARFLTDPEDGSFSEDIIAAAQAQYEEALAACEEGYSAGVMLFDLSFVNEAGEEVEPALPVSVNLAYATNEDITEAEPTNIRHYTNSENLSIYEDLEFSTTATENANEISYITENCSPFVVTWEWTAWIIYHYTRNLKLHFVNDEWNELNYTYTPDYNDTIDRNNAWKLHKPQNIDIPSEGKKYVYHGMTLSDSYSQSLNFLEEHDYIRFSSNNNWQLGDVERDYFWFIPYNGFHSKVTINQNSDLDLYLVYYEEMEFHYGTNSFNGDSWHEDNHKYMDGTVDLKEDAYAKNPENLDLTQYKLCICTDPNHPFDTEITSDFTKTNGYKKHPDYMDYYFVYVKLDIPAPTGVTQKAAPYAAMVILAAVTAAVMIKRRKGGDVDETSPL